LKHHCVLLLHRTAWSLLSVVIFPDLHLLSSAYHDVHLVSLIACDHLFPFLLVVPVVVLPLPVLFPVLASSGDGVVSWWL